MSRRFEGSYMGDGSKIADDTRLECGNLLVGLRPGRSATGSPDRACGHGVPPLPDTWSCPNCAADKSKFMVIGSATPRGQRHCAERRNAYRRRGAGDEGACRSINRLCPSEAVGFRS